MCRLSADVRDARDEIGRHDSAIERLSPDHQLVLALRFYRDLPIDDIAGQL